MLGKQVFCSLKDPQKINSVGITQWPNLMPFMMMWERQHGRGRSSHRQVVRFLTLFTSLWGWQPLWALLLPRKRRDWPGLNCRSLTILNILFSLVIYTKIIIKMTFEASNYTKISPNNVLTSTALNLRIYKNSKMYPRMTLNVSCHLFCVAYWLF